jgi:hypothetical protein
VKVDKVRVKEKDLERLETEREKEKEIKRQQTKTEEYPAQKYSISIPFAFAFFIFHFSFFILSHLSISFYHLHVSFLYSFQSPLHGILRFQGFQQTLSLQHTALHLARRTRNFHRNPWDQPDYPEILKLNQRYPIDFTGTHWFQQQYNN